MLSIFDEVLVPTFGYAPLQVLQGEELVLPDRAGVSYVGGLSCSIFGLLNGGGGGLCCWGAKGCNCCGMY